MGGKVFQGTSPINSAEERDAILRTISQELNISHAYLIKSLLGSALYKMPIGDLDINMDESYYDIDHIMRILITKYGAENVHKHTNTLFLKFPLNLKIEHDEDDHRTEKFYQVDFMFGRYDWQKFAYAGAKDSKYKGIHRTWLIRAFIAWSSDHVRIENNELIARAGPTFLLKDGVSYRYRHRPFKRNSTERVKTLKEITSEEYSELYWMNPFLIEPFTTNDPQEVTIRYFKRKPNDAIFNSFENLYKWIKENFSTEELIEIISIYKTMLIDSKADIPTEIAT